MLHQAGEYILPTKKCKGTVGWRSPSNIALIKYWGKRPPQLPMNPSVSFTLQNAFTETVITYQYDPKFEDLEMNYSFEGNQHNAFSGRIQNYLDGLISYLPIIDKLKLKITSKNSFPHSAGIASSASAFSSLALCLLDIEKAIHGITAHEDLILQNASFLARLGSGSACRSVYGGFVLWGHTPDVANSSDEYAVDLSTQVHPTFKDLLDVILIVDNREKSVPSSAGHKLMEDNPYSEIRFEQAKKNTSKLLAVLKEGDINEFISIVEFEALSLHAMMLTSFPGYFLMHPGSLEIIKRIRSYRNSTRLPVGFTLDAGPNIHLLFPRQYQQEVDEFIQSDLIGFCKDRRYISDIIGNGPERIYHG